MLPECEMNGALMDNTSVKRLRGKRELSRRARSPLTPICGKGVREDQVVSTVLRQRGEFFSQSGINAADRDTVTEARGGIGTSDQRKKRSCKIGDQERCQGCVHHKLVLSGCGDRLFSVQVSMPGKLVRADEDGVMPLSELGKPAGASKKGHRRCAHLWWWRMKTQLCPKADE